MLPNNCQTIAFIGDSITYAGASQNKQNTTRNFCRGFEHWVPFLTHQRVRSGKELNFGVKLDRARDVLHRIDSIIDAKALWYQLLIGTNDIAYTKDDDFFSTYSEIVRRLLKSGAGVIAIPILPRKFEKQSSREQLWRFNTWITALPLIFPELVVVDPSSSFTDPGDYTYSPRQNFTYDGVHPKSPGVHCVAKAVSSYLISRIPHVDSVTTTVADSYSPGFPMGNLICNPLHAAALVEGGVNPSRMANGWLIRSVAASGVDVKESVERIAEGRTVRTISFGGRYTWADTSMITLTQSIDPDQFSKGDVLESMIEVCAKDCSNVAGISLLQRASIGDSVISAEDGYPGQTSGDFFPQGQVEGVLRAPLLYLAEKPSRVDVQARIYLKGAGSRHASGNVQFGAASLRKIPARPALPGID